MRTILSLGSINADFMVRTQSSPAGPGSAMARELLRTSGGKAANVAVLACRLGAPAVLLGCVGEDDLAPQALAGPEAEGVDLAGVRRRPGPTAYTSIVVPADGAKTILLVPNANEAWADDAAQLRRDILGAPGGSVVVVDLEIPAALVRTALEAARERSFTTVLDPAPAERLDEALLALVDHLTPDHTEARDLTEVDTSSVEGASKAAQQLRDRGAAVVHVKLAAGGCATATDDGVLVIDAPKDLDVVDATGAGDAFAGALAWSLARGDGPDTAAELAVAASACAVTAYGSQESYPSPEALLAMATRVRRR